MREVFLECTCCYRPLTPEEAKMNQEKENYYYSICEECLNKYSNQLIKIVTEGE